MLRDAGADKVEEILKHAAKIYRKNQSAFATNQPFGEGGLFDSTDDLNRLDETLWKRFAPTNKLVEKWIRANVAMIVVGDDGKPIHPAFTGVVESRHPNGTLFEQADVRDGKLRGAYRRWREDGTLERANYGSPDGRVDDQCRPDGRPMRRTIVKGKRKTEEWFYESGALQKRYVSDDKRQPLEPVRVWHENGRLAEEICLRALYEKFGPWRKWFDDGTPKLEAEWREGRELFVRNAWDDDRTQT